MADFMFPYLPDFNNPDYDVFKTRSIETPGYGPDAGDEYGGDSMEDFYDYLLTPRHQKRWSGSGSIKHFGPDRYASVSPEDAAMAEIILGQMETKAQHEFQNAARESELGRRQAAERLMEERTRQEGSGGSIQYGMEGGVTGAAPTRFNPEGGEGYRGSGIRPVPPSGPTKTGPMTDEDRRILAAGGYSDPTEAARIQAQGMADYRAAQSQGQGQGPSRTDREAMEGARNEVDAAAFNLQEEINYAGLEGETAESLLEKFQENPNSVPEQLRRHVHNYFLAKRQFVNAFGGGQGGGGGGGGGSRTYNPATGELD